MTPAPAIRLVAAVAVAAFAMSGARASAAPSLTSASASIVFSSATTCEVTLTLAVTGATQVEHRLEALDGSRTELLEVRDAQPEGAVRDVGHTKSLTVTPAGAAPYTIRYRVEQTPSRPHRCPIWLPTAPADGRSRNVRLTVQVPDATVAAGTMPAFIWTGTQGIATLPHVPAFVIVPFTAAGTSRPWDVSRVMDAVAVATLVGATAIWLRRQQRRRRLA